MESIHKDFILDPETVGILRKISRESGLSMSAVVRTLIREGAKGRIRLTVDRPADSDRE